MDTKYIMQEGRLRAFGNENIFVKTKKAFKLPPTNADGRYFVTINELNDIPDGPEINTDKDLHLKGTELIIDLPDLLGYAAYHDIEFECMGNEVSDFVPALSEGLDLDVNTLQFYLSNDACSVKYIKDTYMNDEEGPTLQTAIIPKGEKQTLRILRRTNMENDMIPSDIASYYENEASVSIEYNGNDITNYERNWGPIGEYEAIVYAEGRIMSQEIENQHISNTMLLMGDIQDTSKKLFNGLPTQTTGIWGDTGITIIDDPSYTGQTLSSYGTKKIYNIPGAYGSLGQSHDLQSKVFNDPDSHYYRPHMYGQPIIRYLNRYLVINKTYKDWGKRVAFWDATNGSSHDKSRSSVEDSLGLYMDLAGNDILGLRWDTLNRDRIEFPGLQEYKTREQNVDDNIFNPVNGNNYGLNQYNTW